MASPILPPFTQLGVGAPVPTVTLTPGQGSMISHTAQPTRMARVTEAPTSPAINSPVDSGGMR